MTHTAGEFIGPLTLETLSRRRVMLDPLELLPDRRIGHIVAADAADAILVAPATARWMAAMANGLVGRRHHRHVPRHRPPRSIVAPAMDGDMYAHPATQANVRTLAGFGYRDRGAGASGPLASGSVGRGPPRGAADAWSRRSSRPSAIVRCASPTTPCGHRSASRRTAPGPGRLARRGDRGWHRGAHRPGPLHRQPLHRADGCRHRGGGARAGRARDAHPRHDIGAAARGRDARRAHPPRPTMRDAVLAALPAADVLVMAAAVADFRPRTAAATKLGARRGSDPRAGTHRGHPGRGIRAGARPRPSRGRSGWPAPSWSASRPRPGRWTVPRRRPPARVSTCWSRTMSRSPAPGSARTPTG